MGERFLVNERFFNERLFYEGEVYDLEPSEIARIKASRQMHHLQAVSDTRPAPAPEKPAMRKLAEELVALTPEQRAELAKQAETLEKEQEAGAAGQQGATRPATLAELRKLADEKGIKTEGLSKAQIIEKLAAAAPKP